MATNILESGRGFPAFDMAPFLRRYEISFAPAGTGAPTTLKGCYSMWSVVRVSAGLFRVTFNHQFNDIEFTGGAVQLNALADRTLQYGPISVANRTVDVRVVDGAGAVADIAADPNNRVNLVIVVRATSQKA